MDFIATWLVSVIAVGAAIWLTPPALPSWAAPMRAPSSQRFSSPS